MTLKRGIIYSVLLHLAVLIISYFGIPSFFEELPPENIVTVELLPVSSVTNVKPATVTQKPTPKPAPQKPEPKKPEPKKPEPPKPQPPKPEPKKPEIKDETPPPPPPKPKEDVVEKVEEKKPEPKKEEPKPEPKKPEPPKPQPPKPEPKKVEPKKPEPKKDASAEDAWEALERDLSEKAEQQAKEEKLEDKNQAVQSNKSDQNYDAGIPLSTTEKDAIAGQFKSCWSYNAGGRDVSQMYVPITVQLTKQGDVINVRAAPVASFGNDPFYAAFVASALRAVKVCSPLKYLPPPEKYEGANGWHEIQIDFRPEL